MHQFYCRAQRWSEPRREVAAARGADEDGVKCLCTCRGWSGKGADVKTQEKYIICDKWKSTRRCGVGGGRRDGEWEKAKYENKEQKGQQNRWGSRDREGVSAHYWWWSLQKKELVKNKNVRETETKKRQEEVREDTQVTGRGRERGSGTTNQVDCLIASCIPLSSPILLIPSTTTPSPLSLTPGASPWQPDRVPNTWT